MNYCRRWMEFLGVGNVEMDRKSYENVRNRMQFNSEAANDFHPLSDDKENPWRQHFDDEPLLREIKMDLDRLYPHGQENYFQDQPRYMNILRNVLFTWCKEHPDIGYRQGMHDLVAVVLYAATQSDGDDNEYVENDVYIIFSRIMVSMEPLYAVHQVVPLQSDEQDLGNEECLFPSKPTYSPAPLSELQKLCHFVQYDLLAKHDPQLAWHLQNKQVLPETYCLRWIRLLLAREFILDDVLRIWDTMLENAQNEEVTTIFPLLPYLCVALLIHFSVFLRSSDNTDCLQLLMRPTEDVHARDIIDSALLLQNPMRENDHRDMDVVEFNPGSLGIVLTAAKSPYDNRLAVKEFKNEANDDIGQAEASGCVRIGDLIESINGLKIYNMTPTDVRKHVALLPRPLLISFLHVQDSLPLEIDGETEGPSPDYLNGEQCYAFVDTSMFQPVFHPPSGSCATHYITGRLFLTNYRCIFQTSSEIQWEMPILSIATILAESSMVEAESLFRESSGSFTIVLNCKDTQTVRFTFRSHQEYARTFKCLTCLAYPQSLTQAFCFDYRPLLMPNDIPPKFDIRDDYRRVGLMANSRFRCIDQAYLLCETYPRYLIVPKDMTDVKLQTAAAFRSSQRLPAVCWIHPTNSAVICRSSQPNIGIKAARSMEDEELVRLLCMPENPNNLTAYQSHRFIIMDARGQLAAAGNKAMGKGTESSTNYRGAKVTFMNMDNIHAVRNSFQGLVSAFDPLSDDNFLAKVESSGWLKHVRLVLRGSWELAEYVHSGVSVLTHCSDGWDRTSQMVSLAELMLDPFYRTLDGFQVLVEKEWCSFGHQFGLRCGHGRSDVSHEQRSPIFVLWLDCVWQILRQFETECEFNQNLLLMLADHVYSCKYGNFMFDCEKARLQCFDRHPVANIWWDIAASRDKFVNPNYAPQRTLLFPSTTWKNIELWKTYFARFDPTFVPSVPKNQFY
ncbi:alpha-1,3-mannosyltransferase [Thraustotheca clavata]|uniref:Alpha-1,3-mannosyltransferase n=1 Tax=Thraustotheca clavata TaxID=74557 RepID=A0A1W0AAE2_9STRA|nr:alpha-1,3-mannosyltransferase [Thraustotheca clavata]